MNVDLLDVLVKSLFLCASHFEMTSFFWNISIVCSISF